PTVAEAGVPGYEATTWTGIVAPARVPRPVITQLNAALNRVMATDAMKDRLAAIGAEPGGGTPEDFAALIRSEYAKWGEVVRRTGAKID
ncbi:MAG TPA: tripartite tricarboxylate transporter substrate-binding protein, partial [Burkholderiales bacterium]|nr:tripartite tricarboxylate transporter substrate-binding protein [Burkholderiales bacterium]